MTISDELNGIREARRRYQNLARRLREGQAHPTLGYHPDRSETDWWKAGEFRFLKMIKTFAIAPEHRVIDYGCGTLRLGGHFMRYLEPGNFFGLDVSPDLIEIGRDLVGGELIQAKAPRLAAIDDRSLADAADFKAAFLFSEAVDYHVVPDELGFYYDALKRLVGAPGSRLLLSVRIAEPEHEFVQGCWARPLEAFKQALQPLQFVAMHYVQVGGPSDKFPGITSSTLEFLRP